MQDWRKRHNPKVASFFCFCFFFFGGSWGNLAEDCSPRGSLSVWRNCSEEVMKEPENMGIFGEKKIVKQQENPWSPASKITTNHTHTHTHTHTQSRHFKLMILLPFYVWEEVSVWAHWNYSLWTLIVCSYYLKNIILHVLFPSLISLRGSVRGKLQWLMACWWTEFVVYWNHGQHSSSII